MNSLADFQSGCDRRHNDPPNLWLAVLAGSLVVHLLLLLSGRLFLFRVTSQKPAGVVAPIELVDLSPKSSNKTTRSTRSSAPKVVTASADSQRAASSEAAPQRAAPIQPAIVQQPIPQLTPQPLIVQQPIPKPTPRFTPQIIKPSPVKPTGVASTPKPQFSSQPTASNDSNLRQDSTSPQSSPSQPAASNNSNPEQDPTSSGNSLPKPSIPGGGGSDSGSPAGSNPQMPDPEVPSVPVKQQRGEGSGVQVALSNPQLGNDGKTIPDQPARPIELSKSIPDSNYPSVIELNFGQSVRLRILVKSTGKLDPSATTVIEGSRSLEYDNQAIELVKQWTFEPALQAGKPVDSLLDISVRIDALR